MRREHTESGTRLRRAVARSSLSLIAGAAVALSAAMGAGCVGKIGDPDASCETCAPEGPNTPKTLETSRFPRLSHLQWSNTVQDLLHLPAPSELSASFTGDPLGGVFDNNETSLLVTPGLWADYQLAAEELSAAVTNDAGLLAQLLPEDAPSDPAARAKAFVETTGKRAYRRPLTTAEVTAYLALFEKGKDVVTGPDDFAKGAQLVLQALLQSPHFIYRIEASSKVAKDGSIPLTGYEVATKLSYMIWNTMPDDALFAAAESGKLDTPEGVRAEAERLLAGDRAHAMVEWFHHQLYQYDHYDDLNKDATKFPTFTPALGADMKREAQMFIDDIVFEGKGGIREILTQPTSFVNDKLAPIYGVEGEFTSEMVKVDLDPEERSGFLTHIGFLASNATKREQHSIHRGVFVNRRVLCAKLPDPPNNVPPLPAATESTTNRERVEKHTGKGTCGASCHGTMINPIGFAFEHYDALGQFQTTENGFPINSADSYLLGDETLEYDDAIELDGLMAEAEQVHACYAKSWLEYGYGRAAQAADEETIATLGKASRKGTQALILALTQTKAFRTRALGKEAP
ncbi:Cellulose-binding domain protein [Minicystis rosea]|nr:Cellulose-binding domain protein [Minicystis rosea]